MDSLRGHFLIATADLLDPNFRRTVVLMLKHDITGAIGVIVNAPLSVTIADALGETVESAQGVEDALHRGGPCQGPLLVLHTDEVGTQILPGVNAIEIESRDDITSVLERAILSAPSRRIRYIVGCSGWAPDQLESELAEGSWLTVAATADDVFADAPEQWDRLRTKAGLTKFIPPDQIPQEPGLN